MPRHHPDKTVSDLSECTSLRQRIIALEQANAALQAENHRLQQQIQHLEAAVTTQQSIAQSHPQQPGWLQFCFDDAPVGLALVSPTHGVIQSNPALQTLLGYSADELQGRDLLQCTHPDDRLRETELLSELVRGKREHIVTQQRYLNKDGKTVWTRTRTTLVPPVHNGAPTRLTLIENITEERQVASVLRESLALLQRIFDYAPVAIFVKDTQGHLLLVNQRSATFMHKTPHELVGQLDYALFPPEVSAILASNDRQVLTTGQTIQFEELFPHNGQMRISHCIKFPIYNAQGEIYAIGGIAHDITEQKQAEEALRASEQKYRLLFDSVPVGLYRSTPEGQFLDVNPATVRLLGYPNRAALLAASATNIYLHLADRQAWQATIERDGAVLNYEAQVRRFDGSVIWIADNSHVVRDAQDRVIAYEGTLEDITERKQHAAEIERLAFTDPLTGLANRRRLYDIGEAVLTSGRTYLQNPALLYLDLDRFKTVNDTLGHDAGDELLLQVALELCNCIRTDDLLARLGGDEFAVLLPHSDMTQAITVAERILERLDRPFLLDEHLVYLGASIGIAVASDYLPFSLLLTQADIAMYRAKAAGGGIHVYDPTLSPVLPNQLHMETELRLALATNELTLYYQPVCDLGTNQVVGVEALLRWPHPAQGLLLPTTFLPLAEEAGLMRELDRWVLNMALAQIKEWDSHWPGLEISINLSTQSLGDPHLLTDLARLLAASDIAPQRIILELTEYTTLRDQNLTQPALARLKALGVRIALDNFGSGYASLTSLQQLPVDVLKINHVCIAQIEHAPRDQSVLRALLALGAGLDLTVVVEGVERPTQLDWLRTVGPCQVQGYLLGPPVPAEQFLPNVP